MLDILLMISVEGEDFDFLRTITNTVKRMSEGELLQIYKAKKLDIDEETYYQINIICFIIAVDRVNQHIIPDTDTADVSQHWIVISR